MIQPSHEPTPDRLLRLRTFSAGQGITIGQDIELSVLAVTGDKVRIAVQAPPSTPMSPSDLSTEEEQGT